MLRDELYTILNSKNLLYEFLIQNDLIKSNFKCSSKKCKDLKNKSLKLSMVKGELKMRCKNKLCKTHYSIRSETFKYIYSSNISISRILELIWFYANKKSATLTAKSVLLNKKTVLNWFKKIKKMILKKVLKDLNFKVFKPKLIKKYKNRYFTIVTIQKYKIKFSKISSQFLLNYIVMAKYLTFIDKENSNIVIINKNLAYRISEYYYRTEKYGNIECIFKCLLNDLNNR